MNKIATTRSLISPQSVSSPDSASSRALFSKFEPVTLSCLEKVVCKMKPAGSPSDFVSSRNCLILLHLLFCIL